MIISAVFVIEGSGNEADKFLTYRLRHEVAEVHHGSIILFADRGYISPRLFDMLFEDGIHLVTGIRANMKNRLMPMWDKIMLRKRCIIETINDMLKNTAQLVHSRHRSVNNFIMNMVAAMAAYCFFDNKPQTLEGTILKILNNLNSFDRFYSELG